MHLRSLGLLLVAAFQATSFTPQINQFSNRGPLHQLRSTTSSDAIGPSADVGTLPLHKRMSSNLVFGGENDPVERDACGVGFIVNTNR